MQIKNKINKFLIVSVFVVILTCVVVFGVLIQSTNRKNAEMIGNIGSIYMEGMNKRIAAHFETIFSLKRSIRRSHSVIMILLPQLLLTAQKQVNLHLLDFYVTMI